MEDKIEKPSAEAKALSLFLMAYKSLSPIYKEKANRIKKLRALMLKDEFSKSDYKAEVQKMLELYGGYAAVVEKTVKFYIEKSGEWKLEGVDKYCLDARKVADNLLAK